VHFKKRRGSGIANSKGGFYSTSGDWQRGGGWSGRWERRMRRRVGQKNEKNKQ